MTKRIIASILVILSGLITITEKFYTFHFDNNFGFYDSQTLVWTFSQMFAPILLMLAFTLNPYKVSFTVPVYLYSVQIYFIFSDHISDRHFINHYAIGSVLLFLLCIFLFNRFIKEENNKSERISALENLLDLHISLSNAKK